MNCKKCDSFFTPTGEEAVKIAKGEMEMICLDCAIAASREAQSKKKIVTIYDHIALRQDGKLLYRIEYRKKDHSIIKFMEGYKLTMKRIRQRRFNKRPEPRTANVGVSLLRSSPDSSRTESYKYQIHTNMYNYRELHQSLWFQKIPSTQCPISGAGRIEVAKDLCGDLLVDVDDTPHFWMDRIPLVNGDYINLFRR